VVGTGSIEAECIWPIELAATQLEAGPVRVTQGRVPPYLLLVVARRTGCARAVHERVFRAKVAQRFHSRPLDLIVALNVRQRREQGGAAKEPERAERSTRPLAVGCPALDVSVEHGKRRPQLVLLHGLLHGLETPNESFAQCRVPQISKALGGRLQIGSTRPQRDTLRTPLADAAAAAAALREAGKAPPQPLRRASWTASRKTTQRIRSDFLGPFGDRGKTSMLGVPGGRRQHRDGRVALDHHEVQSRGVVAVVHVNVLTTFCDRRSRSYRISSYHRQKAG